MGLFFTPANDVFVHDLRMLIVTFLISGLEGGVMNQAMLTAWPITAVRNPSGW